MTLLSRIFFSGILAGGSLPAETVSGRVELRDSRDPAVRKKLDYSGVVISLEPVGGAVPVRQSISHAKMIQKDKTFSPHVLVVTVGTVVDFPNLDPIFHNAFSKYNGQTFDVGLYPPGGSKSIHFKRAGVVRLFCNIHSSMSAIILVLNTPYFATTKRDGSFEIPDVPPGLYTLNVFHERAAAATLAALTSRITVPDKPVAVPTISISESGYLPIPHKNKYDRDYPPLTDDGNLYPGARQ
jgi:plastocyanin